MHPTPHTFGRLTSVSRCAWPVLALSVLAAAWPAYAADPAPPRASITKIDVVIEQAGRSRPDWWNSVQLEFPKTLDLSWPARPPGGWNASKNVGQYMWSVINENPSRWRSGTKFMHYLISVHKDNPDVLNRVIGQLAHCYQDLLRDWPRAAFWRRKQLDRDPDNIHARIGLAECYFRLGSKPLATAELNKVGRYVTPAMIKLWADMGELRKALLVARGLERHNPLAANLAAANACRQQGRYDDAITLYKRVLAVPATGRLARYVQTVHQRARASIEAIKLFDKLDLSRVRDGTHTGSAMSYAGQITVAVTVKSGRIVSVKVTQCKDKQYFSALTETPAQIVRKQSVKGVEAVTRATITSNAIINATARALAGATK